MFEKESLSTQSVTKNVNDPLTFVEIDGKMRVVLKNAELSGIEELTKILAD